MQKKANPINNLQNTLEETQVAARTERRRQRIVQVYIIFALIGFIVLTAFVKTSSHYFPVDIVITSFLQHFNSIYISALMNFISLWGYEPYQSVSIALILLSMFFVLRWKKEAILLLSSVIAISILNTLLKSYVDRPRPSVDLVNVFKHLSDASFPSGHVLTYTVLLGFLSYLVFTKFRKSRIRDVVIAVMVATIALVGPSRIYLGAHWFSDVVGAYILGSICLLITIYIYQKLKVIYEK